MKLKPCPFCGGAPFIYLEKRTKDYLYYSVKCGKCGVEKILALPYYVTSKDEVEMRVAQYWNNRAAEHAAESEE